ncbi:MAG: hypothetical protein K2K37_09770, partial [Muribaculaceae bacterium]|nr:hypothetical protein [Muribaculaceae bacterium]
MVFAQRIVGNYKDKFRNMFNLLIGLDDTTLSKIFLREKSILEYNGLRRYAIIEDSDEFRCSIHSVVLSAIKTVVGEDYSKIIFLDHLDKYLVKHVFPRDAGLYTFAAAHSDKLLKLLDDKSLSDSLRKLVLLACLYSSDTYTETQRYLDLFGKVELHPAESELDLRLLMEYNEIEERKLRNESNDTEFRKEKILDYIRSLQELQTDSSKSEALRYHHIGKWQSNIKKYEEAENNLLKAIDINPKSFHSHLRLARNYNKLNRTDKATAHLESILGWRDKSEVPISVRLSAYEMLGGNEYDDLRTKFIDNRLEEFASDIYASFSESYSHTYSVISMLANHLSYNFPEFFYLLCARLPMPLNIENDAQLRKNF